MMTLATLLRELATHYRRYGDVPVVIETPDRVLQTQAVEEDIFNVDPTNVQIVIVTEGVETETLTTDEPPITTATNQTTSTPPKQTQRKRGTTTRKSQR